MKCLKAATCLILALFLFGCVANRPAFTPLRAEKFTHDPLAASRLYVILNLPYDYRSRLGEQLGAELAAALRERGIAAAHEFQPLNPLALDSGIRFHMARQFQPDAIMVIRLGESSAGSMGAVWTLHFDLLDGKGKGVWRGTSTLYRLTPMPETANQLARDVVKRLGDESVIVVTRKQQEV